MRNLYKRDYGYLKYDSICHAQIFQIGNWKDFEKTLTKKYKNDIIGLAVAGVVQW